MLTVKQFRGISLAVMLLAVLLAIGSVSMARFAKATFRLSSGSQGVEYSITVGAFHACVDFDIGAAFSACGSIDKDCTVTILGQQIPPTNPPLPSWYNDECTKFNAFRGILVTAILLACFATIAGVVYLVVNPPTSPKWSLGLEIAFIVMTALASIMFIGSLIAVDQTISGLPSVGYADDQGNALGVKTEKYTSFALEGAAVAFALIALVLWVVARFVGRKPAATSLEGMALTGDSSPTSGYAQLAPGQPQPLFNYGAPPPQPNYQYGNQPQYGGNPNMPPQTNYGFGYQPPPPQTQ